MAKNIVSVTVSSQGELDGTNEVSMLLKYTVPTEVLTIL